MRAKLNRRLFKALKADNERHIQEAIEKRLTHLKPEKTAFKFIDVILIEGIDYSSITVIIKMNINGEEYDFRKEIDFYKRSESKSAIIKSIGDLIYKGFINAVREDKTLGQLIRKEFERNFLM